MFETRTAVFEFLLKCATRVTTQEFSNAKSCNRNKGNSILSPTLERALDFLEVERIRTLEFHDTPTPRRTPLLLLSSKIALNMLFQRIELVWWQ